ncbi:hypothetical protein RhiirA1_478268, partial [Rhizophagus irregularis]
MSKKDIEYTLMLLTIQDLNDSFDSFNDNELNNNTVNPWEIYYSCLKNSLYQGFVISRFDCNNLIKKILLALSSLHYLVPQNYIPKSQHWRLSSKDDILSICSQFEICEAKYIEGDDYVLGDSAYPISSFLITPFKNPFNHRQCQFNFIYSKHRVVVEYAFGKLKAKFKALKELSVKDIKTAIKLAD